MGSLPQRGSTPSGSEAPSWLPSPPSSRCGSPSRSTTSAAPPSSTASASKSAPPPIHSGQKSFHIDIEICNENHVLLYRFSMYGKVNITKKTTLAELFEIVQPLLIKAEWTKMQIERFFLYFFT